MALTCAPVRPLQVLGGDVRPGAGVCLPGAGAHDLPAEAGPAALALRPLPHLPHPAGRGQPAGAVLHVAGRLGARRDADLVLREGFFSRAPPPHPKMTNINSRKMPIINSRLLRIEPSGL